MGTEMLYKVLGESRESYHGGKPMTWVPGDWVVVDGPLVPCQNGLHLCRRQDLIHWFGPTIWIAEADGDRVDVNGPFDETKVVVRRARIIEPLPNWNERTMRLFACDCAERVLHIIERDAPNERRCHQAIEVARCYANGQATQDELYAAWAAARTAARTAAWAAERQWQTERMFDYIEGRAELEPLP